MFPFLRLGPFLIQMPLLALLLGVLIGLSVAEKEAGKLRLKPELIYNLVFYSLIAGIIGARLGYASRFLSTYLQDPLALFSLSLITLSASDGLIIALIVAIVYGARQQLPLRSTLDALAPGLAIFMIFLGMSHFLDGSAYGAPSQVPWAIYQWGVYRHPSQVYETLVAISIFFAMRKRVFGKPRVGSNFALTLALFAASRLFLEAFRGDSLIVYGGFRAAQVISLLVLLFALLLTQIWASQKTTAKKAIKP